MLLSGEIAVKKRTPSQKTLEAFGLSSAYSGSLCKTIRQGSSGITIYTIGYERRTVADLMKQLHLLKIEVLADVREKPISRRYEFNAKYLMQSCIAENIDYQPWPNLGSTEELRDQLKASGDIKTFHKNFRDYTEKKLTEAMKMISSEISRKSVALMCYERNHEDCHRSMLAEILSEQLDATVVAIC